MSVLENIARYKRDEVAAAKALKPLRQIMAEAKAAPPPRGFKAALQESRSQGKCALVAELKKASPSAGLIRSDFDPARLALAYERAGATCLSVLTDAPSFKGADSFLTAARRATALPVLRKDFMLDPYQVVQSRSLGADAILVILAMVDDEAAKALMAEAADFGMDALVEVHDEEELDRALALNAGLIGINNRDLKTFVTDIGTCLRLKPKVPADRHVVAESGLSTAGHLQRLAAAGITSYLIGESLMRADDVEAATRALIGGVTP